jgi:hypothetical protein
LRRRCLIREEGPCPRPISRDPGAPRVEEPRVEEPRVEEEEGEVATGIIKAAGDTSSRSAGAPTAAEVEGAQAEVAGHFIHTVGTEGRETEVEGAVAATAPLTARTLRTAVTTTPATVAGAATAGAAGTTAATPRLGRSIRDTMVRAGGKALAWVAVPGWA